MTKSVSTRKIRSDLTFGLDVGIASVGWAVLKNGVLDLEAHTQGQKQLGAFCWSLDEEGKRVKGEKRRARRTIKRRRQRMGKIRRLFKEYGLAKTAPADLLFSFGKKVFTETITPLELRARGLDKLLSREEFALALGHIAKHRGFLSNSKKLGLVTPKFSENVEATEATEATDEDGKMKAGVQQAVLDLRTGPFRTLGEMFARDPKYRGKGRTRNRDGIYDFTADRGALREEVKALFSSQRARGSEYASQEFEDGFIQIAFSQKPIQDSEHLVGPCIFERTERRCSMNAPSFELRRLYEKLNTLSIVEIDSIGKEIKDTSRRVVVAYPELNERIWELVGKQKGLTYKRLRALLKLDGNTRFTRVDMEREQRDLALSSTKRAGSLEGNYVFCQVLGADLYQSLIATDEGLKQLDAAAQVLTFREDPERIKAGLKEQILNPVLRDKLTKGLESNAFRAFSKAGGLSSKACRKLLTYLREGMTYSEACKEADYEIVLPHRQITTEQDFRRLISRVNSDEYTNNAVVKKALTESLRQLWCLIQNYGLPDQINIEVTRHLSKSEGERAAITSAIEKATKNKNRLRENARNIFGKEPSDTEFERYCLWLEFDKKCIYSGKKIQREWLFDGANCVEVDHILPWSRSFDNSYQNKVLVLKSANQSKGNLTAYEWITQQSIEDIQGFKDRVKLGICSPRKKKNLLRVLNDEEGEIRSKERFSQDTSYIARFFRDLAGEFYPEDHNPLKKGGKRHVRARPGQLTSALRKAWGIDHLKYKLEEIKKKKSKVISTEAGESLKAPEFKRVRVGDTNHAVDALVVACVSEGELRKFSEMLKWHREKTKTDRLGHLDPPWKTFKSDLIAALKEVTVVRFPQNRTTGAIHAETLRGLDRSTENQTIYSRVDLAKARSGIGMTDAKYIQKVESYIPKLKTGIYTNPKTGQEYDKAGSVKQALEEWIALGCPKGTFPQINGREIKRITVKSEKGAAVCFKANQLPKSGFTTAESASSSLVRIDVFVQTDKKGKKTYRLIPIYRPQLSLENPPNAICKANTNKLSWPLLKGERFKFSLRPRTLISYQVKAEDKVSLGYVAGIHIKNAAIECYPTNTSDSNKKLNLAVMKFVTFEKHSIDRLGRISKPIRNEERLWHGKPCTSPEPAS